MRSLFALLLAIVFALTNVSALSAQQSAFVTTLGKDTLSIEQYTRDVNHVAGDWVTFYGGIMVHHYDITLRPDGSVEHTRLTLHRRNGKIEEDVDLTFGADLRA